MTLDWLQVSSWCGGVVPAVCVATGSCDWLPEEPETEGAVKVLCLHCFWINVTVFLKQGCHEEVSCFSVEPSGIIWYPSPSIALYG